jgi:NAD-dependent dihydropyrimidine dehydrogenase PreA subunit
MSLRYFTSALTLELDGDRCTGCGRCVEVCPQDVFAMVRVRQPKTAAAGKPPAARLQASIVGRDRCIECGACAMNCAAGAIKARAGVGCATAIINGMIHGTEPTCGCGSDGKGESCCRGGNGPSCGQN